MVAVPDCTAPVSGMDHLVGISDHEELREESKRTLRSMASIPAEQRDSAIPAEQRDSAVGSDAAHEAAGAGALPGKYEYWL